LESVSSAKYLGIALQSDLKWTQHASNIVANAKKVLDFLKETVKPPTGFFLFVIVRTEHLTGWKAISQSLSHLAAASRSSWRLSQSFWLLVTC
jgi:hypothetical protein